MSLAGRREAATLDGGSAALVVGGGMAGAAIATLLAREGRRVTLIEQQAGPAHKVCGEFLSAEALHYLTLLGVDARALGAVSITRVRFATGRGVTERKLPFEAVSLTRKRLDEALLERAGAAGAVVMRGARVESLTHIGGYWVAAPEGETVVAPTAFLATGKRDLRGHARGPGVQNSLMAFKQYFRLGPDEAAELDSCVELILFPGGYAGLQPVEGGLANLCLLVDQEAFQKVGGTWADLLEHMKRHNGHLARRLEGAEAVLEKPLALARIPYGYLRDTAVPRVFDGEASAGGPGLDALWHLGDQAAVIPSFSGDGMSIALHTAHEAARMFAEGLTPHDFYLRLRGELQRQMTVATTISRAMVAPAMQPFVGAATRLFPGLLGMLASATRIRENALL